MKIGVIGAGVIGSLFAGRLSLAGHEVELAARGPRLALLRERGLHLVRAASGRRGRSAASRASERAPVAVVEALDPGGAYDYVILAPRAEQLVSALEAASRLAGAAAFVTMANMADGGAEAARVLGAERLILGFPGAGGSILEDGSLEYALSPSAIQRTTFGEAAGGAGERAARLARACSSAGLPAVLSTDMASWLRTHLAMVSPIAQALYAAGGEPGALARDRALLRTTVEAVLEGYAAVERAGGRVETARLGAIRLAPRGVAAAFLGSFLAGPLGETLVARHARRARPEMDRLEADFLAWAEALGAPCSARRRLLALAAARS